MSDQKKSREKKLLKPHALENEDEDQSNNSGIDVAVLERRLEGLRDTQESVQGLSLWCQTNKRHSSIIIETWLRVLRKSPVEKRLTLFYLCNDVIQHAKKKNDLTVVNQWAFAVQKATPHVRTPSSVSAAISRIFKIWEERSVYSKDAIADLLSLLNNVPAKDRVAESNRPETYTASAEKVSAFQPSSLISKVKLSYRLKSHLGVTFRSKRFVDMDMESFKAMIKNRSHGMEVVAEISQYLEQLKASEAKLSTEVEERRKIVETAEIALVFYENVRGEAKIVNAAYKNFTNRVMSTKEKVDEKLKTFEEMEGTISPVPSPPAVAPSPPPDEEEFGVRPADECGGSYSHSNLPNSGASYMGTAQTSANEISDLTSSTSNHVGAVATNSLYTSTSVPVNENPSAPTIPQFDANQAYQTMTSIQQQLQHTWSTTGMVDTYATMSMSIPNLNFMQQFQQPSMPIMSTGYGGVPLQPPYANLGYETYQPTHPADHQSSPPLPPPDLTTIPLPPGPNHPPPGPSQPPLPQEAPPDQSNLFSPVQPQPPPPPNNPFEAEYDPQYPQHSNFPDPTGYEPTSHQYNSQPQPSTPTDISPNSRYHPYNNNQSPRGRSVQAKLNNLNTNRYTGANNTSPTGSQLPPSLPDMSPMERFSQSLNKSRNSGMNNKLFDLPESPSNTGGDWPLSNKEEASQSNFVQSQNPYFLNSSFNDFDDSHGRPDGMNGSGSDAGSSGSMSDPYMLQAANNNPFDISQPAISNNLGNMRGNMHNNINNNSLGGGMRGMKQMNSPRGRGNPRGAGGSRGARGFSGGFRGRGGMMRGAGPPRGRGRF